MDQFRSFLGDPIPTVPQHNLVTRLESLQWCGFDLRAQGSQSAKEKWENFLTLGHNMLCNLDHFQGGRAIWSCDDLFQQPVEARNGRLSIFGELE